MEAEQWHYIDKRSGKSLGPVNRNELEKLVGSGNIGRSTLVWNPTMPEWVEASATDLVGVLSHEPPQLPAGEIDRSLLYALALIPLIGLVFQAVGATAWAAAHNSSALATFDQRAWILISVVVNGVLGGPDERTLRKVGLRVRGAPFLAGFFTPIYIFAGCACFRHRTGRHIRSAYRPLLIWFAAVLVAFLIRPLLFNPDAPLIFRPDEWL